ncbi:MAG: amidohydrolase, partial [Myxococcota bacterium]
MKRADSIFVGASVVTMDPGQPRAEALAVRGGRILAVGRRDRVLELRGPDTRMVDLGGQCLLPGLVEPHTHPDLCAQCYAWIDVSGFSHREARGVEQALQGAVGRAQPGEWLFAFGLDPMLTPDLGSFGRERLDAIAPHNPLSVMIQSMHTLFVNSQALQAAGIDESTPDPPGGGRFQRDTSGRLTGKIEEAPAELAILRFDAPSPPVVEQRIREQYRRYARAGLTTIGMPGLFVPLEELEMFQKLAAQPDVPLRLVAYLRHHQIDRVDWRPGDGDDLFRVQGVKLWYDGSPYSGTMLLDAPYLDSQLCCCTLGIPPGTLGHANFEPGELGELVLRLHREGWQVLTHAQGDRGTREILDLYEQALTRHERGDHRWRIEHCALISPDDLARARRLGVAPSFHVNHVHYYGPELRDAILGSERAERLMPVGSALAAGHRVSLHADSPMYPPEPFRLMRTAVTRQTRNGEAIAPSEAISAEQALRAITLDAAWQLFADDRVGSLQVGKLADLTVVDRNPLEIEPEELDRVQVLETWLG